MELHHGVHQDLEARQEHSGEQQEQATDSFENLKKEIIELFMGHLVSLALNGQHKNTA